jgi:hypothetical protein
VRASNGALIITTKSGKNLASRKVEFHTSVGFDKLSQVPEMQNIFAQGTDGVWIGGNANSFGPKIADLEYDGDPNYKWDPNGRLVPKGSGNGTPAMAYNPYDFFQTGLSTNNRLSVSNGNDLGTYFFSISNLNQDGIVPNNNFVRNTIRSECNFQPVVQNHGGRRFCIYKFNCPPDPERFQRLRNHAWACQDSKIL